MNDDYSKVDIVTMADILHAIRKMCDPVEENGKTFYRIDSVRNAMFMMFSDSKAGNSMVTIDPDQQVLYKYSLPIYTKEDSEWCYRLVISNKDYYVTDSEDVWRIIGKHALGAVYVVYDRSGEIADEFVPY